MDVLAWNIDLAMNLETFKANASPSLSTTSSVKCLPLLVEGCMLCNFRLPGEGELEVRVWQDLLLQLLMVVVGVREVRFLG
jgi:hypothetical protein